MIQQEKKYFGDPQSASGNFDDADFAIGLNQWTNMENLRIGSTDKGVTGTLESIGGTLLLSNPQPSVNFITIGVAEDEPNNRFLYFQFNTTGVEHRILCYDASPQVKTIYTVILSSQVVGGLNFSKNYLIHSARVINGIVYFTDNLNNPRAINIDAGIKMNNPSYNTSQVAYVAPVNAEAITVIKKPPVYPIQIQKITDGTVNTNLIRNNAFLFTYFYTYRKGENSTPSPWSKLAPYNFASETYNGITLTVPFNEIPDQTIQSITICVIYADTKKAFYIKTWNKNNSADDQAIQDHINLINPLSYNFFNNDNGQALDPADLVRLFDSVPLTSATLETFDNRLGLGNNLVGYDAPASSSMSMSIYSVNPGVGVGGDWIEAFLEIRDLDDPNPATQIHDYLFYFLLFGVPVDGTHPAGYYAKTVGPYGVTPPLPSSITITDYTYIGPNPTDVLNYMVDPITGYVPTFVHYSFVASTINGTAGSVTAGGGSVTSNVSILKSGSPYRGGMVFYDRYLRQCSVVTNSAAYVRTPERAYSTPTIFNYGIQWAVNNTNALTEIPTWAYFYAPVFTKSLRALSFEQARAGAIVYATKDADGNYFFTSTTYATSNAGIALKLDLLDGYGFGYQFSQGDMVKIYLNTGGTVYDLSIINQVGYYIIAELKDLGSLAGISALFEIYTPITAAAAETFYEVGDIFPVNDPGTSARQYSTLTGFVPGDVYLITRGTGGSTYLTENMSPNDAFWKNWFTSAGRTQIITTIGQQLKTSSIKWSNTLIEGSTINGLNTFEALNEKLLSFDMGPLRKLQVTSKVENQQGVVMLAICEKQTASLYIAEVQQYDANKATNLVVYDNVIGTVNPLKGDYGTVNPESVIEFRGEVFWVDAFNRKVIQYSGSGLFPISNYKMERFWNQFFLQYNSMTAAQIEALGSRPFIFGQVDRFHNELLFTVPKLLSTPPKGYLPDYPSTIYPFDIWDGQAKTLVYSINANPNFWIGAYSFTPEYMASLQGNLYGFKNGLLYIHNQPNTPCLFYGTQYKPRIMPVSNAAPTVPKIYNNISVQSNLCPTFVYLYNEYPYQQASDLVDFSFQNREGVWYANILRNKLVPTATGFNTSGLLTAERMRNVAMRILIEFTVSSVTLELKFVYIGFTISAGHNL